jgi:hypothetical protein
MKICTTLGEVNMNSVRKEIRDLITINEKIQSALLNGDRITDDEATLIRQCASELLQNIPAPKPARATTPRSDGDQEMRQTPADQPPPP